MQHKIPQNHPRYVSLMTREKISQAMKNGLVHETGLIAHGRGEAFDYIIGEKTLPLVDMAEKVAVAALLLAKNPVISVNGNVVALAAEECVSLADAIPAKLEINLFHKTDKRVKEISKELYKKSAKNVYGEKADARIPGLNHDRGVCDKDGIFSSDVILVPLEDGDRCQALRKMGKTVIAIDLNPLSRTAKTASITIVDNITRALPNMGKWVKTLKMREKSMLEQLVKSWNNEKMLMDVQSLISKRLNSLV